MKKKIGFGLAMLIALTTSLSAQVTSFKYSGNINEQQFIKLVEEHGLRASKLPNAVIQVIYDNLHSYSLDIGDVFLCTILYKGVDYLILLRITDAKNCKWQYSVLTAIRY